MLWLWQLPAIQLQLYDPVLLCLSQLQKIGKMKMAGVETFSTLNIRWKNHRQPLDIKVSEAVTNFGQSPM
jgi:hypothetical protein